MISRMSCITVAPHSQLYTMTGIGLFWLISVQKDLSAFLFPASAPAKYPLQMAMAQSAPASAASFASSIHSRVPPAPIPEMIGMLIKPALSKTFLAVLINVDRSVWDKWMASPIEPDKSGRTPANAVWRTCFSNASRSALLFSSVLSASDRYH